MPSPGTLAPARLPIEDTYLELLADTLESLDLPARGQFLQRFLRAICHVELRESECVQIWDEMLNRRRALTDQAGRPVVLKAALMDVLATAGMIRVPVILEYEELKKLELNAVTDPLTGLYNRRLFSESFEKELNRARRYTQPLSLVILDLHRFKEVNDKHGHPRGDEVLRATAATLKKALRSSDSAFRIGGDEFALLLPQTDAQQALALSRRVEAVFVEILQPLQLQVAVSMDNGNAMIHADGNLQLQRLEDLDKYRFDAAAERKSLLRVRLRQEQGELIASDAEGRVGSAQSFLERCRRGAQNLITAGVAVFVVYFFEAVQIQNHQAQRLRVTARTIQFFFERFSKKPAVVEAGQGIGDRIQFELLEFLVLQDDRHTEKSGSSEHIHKSRLQNNGTARLIGEGPTAIEHFVPDLHTLRFAQFNVTDCAEKALEKLSPRGQVETLECIRKQLEIRVL